MALDAVGLVLLSAVLHAGWNVLTKSSSDPKLFSLMTGLVIVPLALAALALLPLGTVPAEAWRWMLLSGAIHTLYIYALSAAYQSGEISYVYPIARSAPAFVPLLAWWAFGERVSTQGWWGIVGVSAGLFLIQLQGPSLRHSVRGLGRFLRRPSCIWAFITLTTVVAYSVVDKAGMVAMGGAVGLPTGLHAVVYFLIMVSVSSTLYAGVLWRERGRIAFGIWRGQWRQILLSVAGGLVSYSLILHVLAAQPLSYVVALRQASILLAVLAGGWWLRERQLPLRLLAAGVMVAGLALVASAP